MRKLLGPTLVVFLLQALPRLSFALVLLFSYASVEFDIRPLYSQLFLALRRLGFA